MFSTPNYVKYGASNEGKQYSDLIMLIPILMHLDQLLSKDALFETTSIQIQPCLCLENKTCTFYLHSMILVRKKSSATVQFQYDHCT